MGSTFVVTGPSPSASSITAATNKADVIFQEAWKGCDEALSAARLCTPARAAALAKALEPKCVLLSARGAIDSAGAPRVCDREDVQELLASMQAALGDGEDMRIAAPRDFDLAVLSNSGSEG